MHTKYRATSPNSLSPGDGRCNLGIVHVRPVNWFQRLATLFATIITGIVKKPRSIDRDGRCSPRCCPDAHGTTSVAIASSRVTVVLRTKVLGHDFYCPFFDYAKVVQDVIRRQLFVKFAIKTNQEQLPITQHAST